jgi:hypothetical protein
MLRTPGSSAKSFAAPIELVKPEVGWRGSKNSEMAVDRDKCRVLSLGGKQFDSSP